MPFLDTMKSILKLDAPRPTAQLVVVSGANNHNEVPFGFFNVLCASGRTSLGFRGNTGLFWDVGETVNDGKRVTLDKPRAELPTVKLDFRSNNTQAVMGCTVIDTDSIDSDGSVEWCGDPPATSIGYR
jgi:hypothetical protein